MLIAFDTDIFTDVMYGDPRLTSRLAAIPVAEQTLAVVVIEEVIRGRFNAIRQAEASRGPYPGEGLSPLPTIGRDNECLYHPVFHRLGGFAGCRLEETTDSYLDPRHAYRRH